MAFWSQPATADIKFNLPLDSNSQIITEPTTATAGERAFTLKGFKRGGTFDEADAVFTAIFKTVLGVARFNKQSGEYVERRGVVDE